MAERTILVADDEPSLRSMAEEGLRLFGYRVITAASGEEALEILKRRGGEVDLVVLDLVMPGMGGERCFEALREAFPGLKVLLTSGKPVPGDLRDKASGVLSKPFSLMELVEAVKRALGQRGRLSEP